MMKNLAKYAQNIISDSGVNYGDIRIQRNEVQEIYVQDRSIKLLNSGIDEGFGVRVLHNNKWGFASHSGLNKNELRKIAKEATKIAIESSRLSGKDITLADKPVYRDGFFKTAIKIDPFDIPISEKLNLAFSINDILLKSPIIKKAVVYFIFVRRHQFFISTEGDFIETITYTTGAEYRAYAVDKGDMQGRSFQMFPMNKGYEHIESLKLIENAERVREESIEKLYAEEPSEGKKDLILAPSHLALTIHESVGHATELDRVLGYEQNFAGGSFATPEKLGKFRYGSKLVNFIGDNTLKGGLATTGWDDEGVKGKKWYIVKEGILNDYSSTREVAPSIGEKHSRGSARAQDYANIPINRIPNLLLAPGKEKVSPDDLIADTKDGIFIDGMGSFSIDQQRLNFQFGGDLFYEIKNGKKVRPLKNVIYHSITPKFWGSLVGLTDKRFWMPYGVLNCGKGEPEQIAKMTHGAPYTKFSKVDVGRGKK